LDDGFTLGTTQPTGGWAGGDDTGEGFIHPEPYTLNPKS